MLGIQAGIQVDYRLEGSEMAVEQQQQQLELSVRGTVRKTLLQEPQALKHHCLVPCNQHAHSQTARRRPSLICGEVTPYGWKPTCLSPKVYVHVSRHEAVHVGVLQLRLQGVLSCKEHTLKSQDRDKILSQS